MGHEERQLVRAARPPVGDERLLAVQRLGLDEKLAEGRMLAVRVVQRQGEFHIAGEVQPAAAGSTVDQGDPAQFHIVLGGDDDLHFGVDAVVAAAKGGPVQIEVDLVSFRLTPHRVIGRGPELFRLGLVQVAEDPPRIQGLVRAPAGELLPAPLAVAGAAVGDHQAVAAVTEQQALGRRGVRGAEASGRRRDQLRPGKLRHAVAGREQLERRQGRDALLQQRLEGAHPRVAVEAAGKGVAVEEVGQGEKGHPLVMGHVGLDDHPALAVALRLPAEIYRLEVAEIAQEPEPRQPFQVLYRFSRSQAQGQQGGIGGHHQLLVLASFQAEFRHAEGVVLVGLFQVQIGEGGLRYAPGDPVFAAIGDLDRHRFPGRLVQERVGVAALEQKRHQVLEHGPGPAQEDPLPADGSVGAPQ